MRKINILLAAICVVLMASCSGFLDKKPTNQADSSTTIMNTNDAQVMINGVMSKMLSSSYYGRNFLLWGDGRSGDVTTVSAGNGGDGWLRILEFLPDGQTIKVNTYSPLFGISPTTKHLAHRTAPFDQFDMVIEK